MRDTTPRAPVKLLYRPAGPGWSYEKPGSGGGVLYLVRFPLGGAEVGRRCTGVRRCGEPVVKLGPRARGVVIGEAPSGSVGAESSRIEEYRLTTPWPHLP